MYAWLWHRLPGGTAARAATAAALALTATAILWFAVFPWAASHLPIDGTAFNG
jgi:hypothetical protein